MCSVVSLAQGPLEPSGGPTPTMKTLGQVEPRTPITNLPFTITKPGSYYVAGPLMTGGAGIQIMTNDVVVDLCGFTLEGSSGAPGDHGIQLVGGALDPRVGIVVRNGGVDGFYHGVSSDDAAQCVFEDLTVHGCAQAGFLFQSGAAGLIEANTVRDCVIAKTGGPGISFVSSAGAICRQNVITDTVITETGGTAVEIVGGGGMAAGNRITRCVVSYAAGAGMALTSHTGGTNAGNVIESCQIFETSADGILISATNGGACAGNVIRGCNVSHAGPSGGIQLASLSSGHCLGNVIEECTVSDQGLFGIYVLNVARSEGNVIRDNIVWSGTEYGVNVEGATATRIEDNHVHGVTGTAVSSVGIYTSLSASSNLIVRNSAIRHTFNFLQAGADTYGPYITTSGALLSTGVQAHAAANFSQ